ncbi:MAG: hypothetical protein F6J87_07345 [Spirulina sp. SIO3F2]|nr:hypothetical protein [Spirulina sp. SIO3F2]
MMLEFVPQAMVLDERNQQLIVAGEHQQVQILSLPEGQVVEQLATPMTTLTPLTTLALSRDGKVLVAGTKTGAVLLWQRDRATEPWPTAVVKLSNPHDAATLSVSITSSGDRVASASVDGSLRVWHKTASEQWQLLHQHDSAHRSMAVRTVQLMAGQDILVTGGDDHLIRLWDHSASQLQPLNNLMRNNHSPVHTLAVLPGDDSVVVGGANGKIILKKINFRGEHYKQLFQGQQGSTPIQALAVNPDYLMVSGSVDRMVGFWDLCTDKTMQVLGRHQKPVVAVAIDQSGQTVVSAGLDQTIQIWAEDE